MGVEIAAAEQRPDGSVRSRRRCRTQFLRSDFFMARTRTGNGPERGGATILIAEDHPDSREALGALLEAFGFKVLLAVDGREAVEVARASRPDLILMDIMMPALDGLEATRRLRGFPETRHIPIITLTALDQAEDKARDAGANDFLAKPINSGVLFSKVTDWLTI